MLYLLNKLPTPMHEYIMYIIYTMYTMYIYKHIYIFIFIISLIIYYNYIIKIISACT